MNAPQRIQLSRVKGWRKPAGAIVVARPSRWGNPYTLTEMRATQGEYGDFTDAQLRGMCVSDFRGLLEGRWARLEGTPYYPGLASIRAELQGHDLACWCPLDQPCHADVLLELANGSPS